MSRVYRAAYHYIRDGVSAVLAEIVDAPESAPQTVGAAMVITANETFGTIGGGVMEAQVIELARSRVLEEKTDLTETVNTHGCADCRVQMIFYDGEKPAVKKHLLELARAEKHALIPMYICGAGHVAREVASLASKMGFRVTVVDDREDMLTPERFPDCDLKVVEDYSNPPECDPKSFILIMTRGHEYDAKALVWALRQDYFYLGMMGS